MTDRNYTCVADAVQPSKKKPIQVGDKFTTNQGCVATVIEYNGAFDVVVTFDDGLYRKTVAAAELRKGKVRNPFLPSVYGVGYTGAGEFSPTIDGKNTSEYSAWREMIKRCYSEKSQEIRPTYKGCTVCEEWHNFQNFAKWYTSQSHYGKGYQVDKDFLIDGNKLYSPTACVLAPPQINSLLTGSPVDRTKYPVGVCWHEDAQKYAAQININGQLRYLGVFDTVEIASDIYQKAKKQYIKEIALEWKDKIDEKLFDALVRRTI